MTDAVKKTWTVVYRPKGKLREKSDVHTSLFETALAAAIELQWHGAQICRIIAPDDLPVPEEHYASIVWRRPSLTDLSTGD
jgi:hypothetical protein